MPQHPTLDDLRSIEVFHDLDEGALAWFTEHMELREAKAGEIVIHAGDKAEFMIAIFAGQFRAERPDGLVFIGGAGEVTGLLPFSRLASFPANVYSIADARFGLVPQSLFPAMLEHIPALSQRLVSLMSDRIRDATRATEQHEKLMALGQLSAGLAHELNNPASAAQRATEYLRKAIKDFRHANVKLAKSNLEANSRRILIELEVELSENRGPLFTLDSLERSDREEHVAAWLEAHKVDSPWTLAPDLVDSGCDRKTLETVAQHVPCEFLGLVLNRLTASLNVNRLLDEIENSMKRITELVQAVKDYSYMDRMPEQEIDIHKGLDTTLIMLKHRLKDGVEVIRDYDPAIPHMTVRGRELNQVWTNLISNAIDAMHGKGVLRIATKACESRVKVDIVDSGSGIDPKIKDKIFEPFFTTKGVNEGTGLGLDIAARLVRNHGGNIQVLESKPGHTVFEVSIPIRQPIPAPLQEDHAVRNSG